MNRRAEPAGLRRLYPDAGHADLEGLYLGEQLRRLVPVGQAFIYANFIASLDGRIAVAQGDDGTPTVPASTANPRDWRLLLELAAPADALIMSGRYLRELQAGTAQTLPPLEGAVPDEICAFRQRLGLPAQPVLVVVSGALDIAEAVRRLCERRRVLVATGALADADMLRPLVDAGAEVLVAGERHVEGHALTRALVERGLRLVYCIAGPRVLHMLLEARALDRLYLTTVLRVLGGKDYASLAEGKQLDPPYDLELTELYLDRRGPDGIAQLLQVFNRPA